MNEMIWFILIGISVTALCYALWLPQHKAWKKAWLLNQLQEPGNNGADDTHDTHDSDSNDKQALLNALEKINKQKPPKHTGVLMMLLIIAPLAFVVQANWFDNQDEPQVAQSTDGKQPPDLATAIKQLEQKLAENPDDIQGQLLYAQSMVAMKRYGVATKAYKKANELQPNDAAILTEWAEAIAFRNNTGSFLGQPSELLAQAIELNPKHQKAMWLYGIVLYEQQQFAESETLWIDLLAMVDSPGVQDTLLKQINQARTAQGKAPLKEGSSTNNNTPPAMFNVTVTADDITDDLPSTATLFVFAKSTDGMPMPIAAQKITGPFSWPVTVKLTDQQSLQGNRLLSQFDAVKLSALISYSGAIEDRQWQSDPVTAENNNNITLNLKRQEP